jgi:hypothetical protein
MSDTNDLEIEKIKLWEDKSIPFINGYWNDSLNAQFGYGLYA